MINHSLEQMSSKEIEDFYILLKDERAYYVMDRVALTQVLYLLFTAFIPTVIIFFGLEATFMEHWYIFIFFVPLFIGVLGIIKKKRFNPSKSLLGSQVMVFFAWCSLTLCSGVVFDFNFGIGTTFFVSLFIALYYIIGYGLARIIRNRRFFLTKRTWTIIMLLSIPTSILFTLLYGLNLLFRVVEEYQIKSLFLHDYGEFLSCLPCAFSIFFMISGIGIVLSMLLNYAILDDLTRESAKSNVIYNKPTKLYFKFLLGTVILIFILWIFLEILIPPIPGGGGGGGGGSGGGGGGGGGGSGGSHHRDISRFTPLRNELEASNKRWKQHLIPTAHMPVIIAMIRKKEKDRGKKKYKVPYSATYKRDFSPRSKHYSKNYSPYHKNYSKDYSEYEEKIYKPLNDAREKMKDLIKKYDLNNNKKKEEGKNK